MGLGRISPRLVRVGYARFKAMIIWCEERVEKFKALSEDLDGFIAPIQERYGISQEWVERAYQQSLEDAKNWNPVDAGVDVDRP